MTDYLYLDISFDCSLHLALTHKGHDGALSRQFLSVTGAKGFWANEQKDIDLRNGLIIPVDRTVTGAIRDFLDFQVMMAGDHEESVARGPYYFTMDMTHDSQFEGFHDEPPLFAGPDTAYADAPQFERERNREPPKPRNRFLAALFGERAEPRHKAPPRNPENITLARYNCWTGAQGITQYVGGVDLGALHMPLAKAYRAFLAVGAAEDLREAALDKREPGLRAEHIGKKDLLIQREGLPPVLSVAGDKRSFSQFMDTPGKRDGLTPAQRLERAAPFTNVPLEKHAHMKPA